MGLKDTFNKAWNAIKPTRTEKVVLKLDAITKSINLTGPEYRHSPEVNEFTMMACGIMPSVRNDQGFTRGYYADPRQVITITPPKPQFSDEPAEAPWSIKSSPAILVHDHLISRWSRGLNIVVRGRMESLSKPNVLMAMQARYDDKGNLTVKRLYMPEFDENRRMSGVKRIEVTPETVDRALTFMVLCREQMMVQGGGLLNPRENLRKATEMAAAKAAAPGPSTPQP